MSPPEILFLDPGAPDPATLARAATLLREGRLVALPTETVYGLGAHARDARAVARIFTAKGRPPDNPLIVHVADVQAAGRVATLTPLARRLAERFWPGPLTLVLEAALGLAPAVTAGLSTVAVRVPDHPVALALLRAAGVPVAAPSANRSGRPSPTTARHVLDDLADAVDAVVDGGACRVGVESTVVDARGEWPAILREGAVTREQLTEALGLPAEQPTGTPDRWPGTGPTQDPGGTAARSPGTRHAHYQPSCAVLLAPMGEGPALAAARARAGAMVGLVATRAAPEGVRDIGRFGDAADLAANLYTFLREAEQAGVDVVIVEAVPEEGIGRAVMDRLRRAADATPDTRRATPGVPRTD